MSAERALRPAGAVRVLMVRHGRTEWNERGRIQGHTDIPLSEAGRTRLRESRIPAVFADFAWQASPLRRAVQSARLLGASEMRTDARLMEMRWGGWEGESPPALRRRLGPQMERMEERGIDFRPPGGESPRELIRRLDAWLRDVREGERDLIAVTHKGVIRAALAARHRLGPPRALPAAPRLGARPSLHLPGRETGNRRDEHRPAPGARESTKPPVPGCHARRGFLIPRPSSRGQSDARTFNLGALRSDGANRDSGRQSGFRS